MIETVTLVAFIPAAMVLNFTPGADMMFCFGQGLKSGPRPALVASAGISLGLMVHVLLAGLGRAQVTEVGAFRGAVGLTAILHGFESGDFRSKALVLLF